MKYIILLVALIILPSTGYSQTLQEAPLNPEFIEYLLLKSEGNWVESTKEGNKLGHIPQAHKAKTSLPQSKKEKADKLLWTPPSSYDLRTQSLLSPVKDQGDCGACWTFTTCAALESNWLKQGLQVFNLSEQNMKNCHGFLWGHCSGGNSELASAYLTRLSGPILESQNAYNVNQSNCISSYSPTAFISDAYYLPTRSDYNYQYELKWWLYHQGALYTDMCWDDAAWNSWNNTYYYSGNDYSNHAVTLVGWDDNYVVQGAPGNGAWIIKNSWGAYWGQNGYFYISYYDTRVHSETAVFPNRLDYNENAQLYYYDKLGGVSSTGFSSSYAYGAVKFTTSNNFSLQKVSSWAAAPGTLSFQVYTGFNGSNFTGLLASLTNQTVNNPGYHSFDLDSPIDLEANTNFYIKVTYSTPGYAYPMPIETAITYYCSPTIETGKFWISSNNYSWTQIGGGTQLLFDLCIRAFGENIILPPAPVLNSPVNNATNVSINPTFSWNSSLGASYYQLQVSSQSNFSTTVFNQSNITTTSKQVTDLEQESSYYWRVRGSNANGYGPWSEVRSFTTQVPLQQPTLLSPADNSTNISITPNFVWQAVPTASSYQLQISGNSGFSSLLLNQTGINTNYYLASVQLENNAQFWWRVKAFSSQSSSAWSSAFTFTTAPATLPSSHNIELQSGWNAISSNLTPENLNIVSIFEDIASNVVIVKNGAGQIYVPSMNFNLIGNWNVKHGYYVYMNAAATLTITGEELVPEENSIPLTQFWSLISYIRNSPMPIETALGGINSSLQIAKNILGQIYSPSWGINQIGNMQTGAAYLLKMNSSGHSLTYHQNEQGKRAKPYLPFENSDIFKIERGEAKKENSAK